MITLSTSAVFKNSSGSPIANGNLVLTTFQQNPIVEQTGTPTFQFVVFGLNGNGQLTGTPQIFGSDQLIGNPAYYWEVFVAANSYLGPPAALGPLSGQFLLTTDSSPVDLTSHAAATGTPTITRAGFSVGTNAGNPTVPLVPSGNNGDLQMKSGAILAASHINDNGVFLNASEDMHFGSGCPYYDVKSFGAVGDGVTDDTTAINAAYTKALNDLNNLGSGGGTVYFPHSSGFYKFSTLNIPSGSSSTGWIVSLFDNGIIGNVIKPGNFNAFIGRSGSFLGGSGSGYITPASTWAQASGQTGPLVDLNGVSTLWFEGINMESSFANTTEVLHIHDNAGNGVTNVVLKRSTINNQGTGFAIAADSSSNSVISGYGLFATEVTLNATSASPYCASFTNFGEIQFRGHIFLESPKGGFYLANNTSNQGGDAIFDDVLTEGMTNSDFITIDSTVGKWTETTIRDIKVADTAGNSYILNILGINASNIHLDDEVTSNIGTGLLDPAIVSSGAGITGMRCTGAGCYAAGLLAATAPNATGIFSGDGAHPAIILGLNSAFSSALTVIGNTILSSGSLQIADQGKCTMSSGACSAQSLSRTYITAPNCFANWTGTGTLTGLIKVPSTTTTVTPASSVGSDTAVVNWFCVGN